MLGLVLALVGLHLWWPTDLPSSSFLDMDLGNHAVSAIEESGFYHDERNAEGPFRWTDGHGRLVIPLDRNQPPEALRLWLMRPRNSRLQVKINDRELVSEASTPGDAHWDKTFDLHGLNLGDQLVLELLSDTVVPKIASQGKNGDARALGVRVLLLKLLSHRDPEPSLPSFLNVTVGSHHVPGVEDFGFHDDEKSQIGQFRWTRDKARLTIPLDKGARPQGLLVALGLPRTRACRITANDRELISEKANPKRPWFWEKTLSLDAVPLGDRLVLDIEANTQPLLITPNGGIDTRDLGVMVRAIRLLSAPEAPAKR
jgi:hypothetical protein